MFQIHDFVQLKEYFTNRYIYVRGTLTSPILIGDSQKLSFTILTKAPFLIF